MLAYSTYSEAGGVGKSTLTGALAQEHARDGRNALAIDLDPQYGSLTHLVGVDAPRNDGEADNIVRHMIDRPAGEFDDLIYETGFGFDIVPSHNMLASLPDLLSRAEGMADDLGDEFDPLNRLRDTLVKNNVPDKYDTLLVDPPATEGPQLYNAISTTANLVIPIEATEKGMQSISGLEELVTNLGEHLEVNIGVLAAVPNGVGRTTDQQQYLEEIRAKGYSAPVAIRDRSSLFDGCWKEQCTPRYYVEHYRDRQREHEMETLAQLDELADHITEVGA